MRILLSTVEVALPIPHPGAAPWVHHTDPTHWVHTLNPRLHAYTPARLRSCVVTCPQALPVYLTLPLTLRVPRGRLPRARWAQAG